MNKSVVFEFFGNIKIPATMALGGLFLLLIGYSVSNEVMIASGWILIILGGGWFLILMRIRIYRLPLVES